MIIGGMKLKIKYRLIIATVILLTFITSTALANSGQNNACGSSSCHTYPPKLINITTDIKSIIVSTNESFMVNISWKGGANDGSNLTAIKWPSAVLNNSEFSPNPMLPVTGIFPNGTTSSVLTAPEKPGNYTVRVYAADGSWGTIEHETNYTEINVTVQEIIVIPSYNVSLSVDSNGTTTSPGVNVTYKLTINNTGDTLDNYTLVVSNPDGASASLDNSHIQNLASGASATVLLNVTNASIGPFRVNVTAKSTGNSNKTATVNTTTTVSIQPTGGAPTIISSSPSTIIFDNVTFVLNEAGDSRIFNIKINQTVNVTWFISGIEVFNQSGVNESSYKNTSAASGFWNVEAKVSNNNGFDSKKWIWIVSKTPSGNKKTQIRIKPETLNLASKGKFKVTIRLPDGYDVNNIDLNTVMCEGAPALKGKVKNKGNVLEVTFNRHDLVNVSTGKAVRLTVTGMLMDGTKFEGSDIIRVINKSNGKYEELDEQDDEVDEDEVGETEDEIGKHSEKVDGRIKESGTKKDDKKIHGKSKENGKKKDNEKVKSNNKGNKLKYGLNEDEDDNDED